MCLKPKEIMDGRLGGRRDGWKLFSFGFRHTFLCSTIITYLRSVLIDLLVDPSLEYTVTLMIFRVGMVLS